MNHTKTILFFGDSLIESWNTFYSFPEHTCKNYGVSGSGITDAFENIKATLPQTSADYLVILTGTNDCNAMVFLGDSDSTIISVAMEKYNQLLSYLQKQNQPYILISLIKINRSFKPLQYKRINTLYDSINGMLRTEVSSKKIGTFVDVNTSLCDSDNQLDSQYTTDGLHLNDQAYTIITSLIRKKIDD